MSTRYFGFLFANDEAVFLEEGMHRGVHRSELFHGFGKDTGVVAVSPGGYFPLASSKRVFDGVASVVLAEGTVEFVHDDHKEEGGKGAALLDCLVHLDGGCHMAGAVCAHREGGALERGHDKSDEIIAKSDAFQGFLDTGPSDGVVGLGDVVVYCIEGFLVSLTIAVAGDGRADRLMDVPSREKGKLGFVKHLVPHQED